MIREMECHRLRSIKHPNRVLRFIIETTRIKQTETRLKQILEAIKLPWLRNAAIERHSVKIQPSKTTSPMKLAGRDTVSTLTTIRRTAGTRTNKFKN